MSRGPGKLERSIRELFDGNPSLAFVTDELAEHCFPDDADKIERKHKVSVLRAAKHVIAGQPDWAMTESSSQGGTWVFHNQASVQSVALADVIGAYNTIYRSPTRIRKSQEAWTRRDWVAGLLFPATVRQSPG